jgi:hypothetical protein
VSGVEHLASVRGPVVYAANHQSHLDTPLILAALPSRLRWRVAVAMAKEYFAPYFHPAGAPWRDRLSSGLLYILAAMFFNAFPIPQREAGARRTLRYVGIRGRALCSCSRRADGRTPERSAPSSPGWDDRQPPQTPFPCVGGRTRASPGRLDDQAGTGRSVGTARLADDYAVRSGGRGRGSHAAGA